MQQCRTTRKLLLTECSLFGCLACCAGVALLEQTLPVTRCTAAKRLTKLSQLPFAAGKQWTSSIVMGASSQQMP